jgi:hypothetical protein
MVDFTDTKADIIVETNGYQQNPVKYHPARSVNMSETRHTNDISQRR